MQKYFDRLEGKIFTYERNEIIKNEGDICNSIFYVIEGEVKIYTYSYKENIYLINTLKEKQIFAHQLLFASNNHFLGNIIASKKSKIKVISKLTFLNACKDTNFLESYLNNVSDNFISLQNRLKILSQKSIREKILFYLEQKSSNLKNKVIPVKSKLALAEYLNIPRPSLSRELINLRDEKLITFDRYSITLLF